MECRTINSQWRSCWVLSRTSTETAKHAVVCYIAAYSCQLELDVNIAAADVGRVHCGFLVATCVEKASSF